MIVPRPLLCLILLLAALGSAAIPASAETEAAAAPVVLADGSQRVEVTLPSGWQLQPLPNLPITVGVLMTEDGADATNVNLLCQPFDGDLGTYVQRNVDELKAMLPEFNLEEQSPVKSASGVEMTKLVTSSNPDGKTLRQTFFLGRLEGDLAFTLTCTCVLEKAKEFDPVFAQIAETLRLKD